MAPLLLPKLRVSAVINGIVRSFFRWCLVKSFYRAAPVDHVLVKFIGLHV